MRSRDIVMKNNECLCILRKEANMNRKEFAEYFGIPYRTLQDWELYKRKMPEYLLRLMEYKLKMEKIVDNDLISKK